MSLLLTRDPPGDLVIPIVLKDVMRTNFHLTNSQPFTVAMKIKFTNQISFKCFPNCLLIEPDKTIGLVLTTNTTYDDYPVEDSDPDSKKLDKISIQQCEYTGALPAPDFWKDVEARHTKEHPAFVKETVKIRFAKVPAAPDVFAPTITRESQPRAVPAAASVAEPLPTNSEIAALQEQITSLKQQLMVSEAKAAEYEDLKSLSINLQMEKVTAKKEKATLTSKLEQSLQKITELQQQLAAAASAAAQSGSGSASAPSSELRSRRRGSGGGLVAAGSSGAAELKTEATLQPYRFALGWKQVVLVALIFFLLGRLCGPVKGVFAV